MNLFLIIRVDNLHKIFQSSQFYSDSIRNSCFVSLSLSLFFIPTSHSHVRAIYINYLHISSFVAFSHSHLILLTACIRFAARHF